MNMTYQNKIEVSDFLFVDEFVPGETIIDYMRRKPSYLKAWHEISIRDIPNYDRNEVTEWIRDNVKWNTWTIHHPDIYFLYADDAMAFKLRWL